MIFKLIISILLGKMVLSLKCKTAWPPNCHYNSTCKYDIKECQSSEMSSNIRGGVYCTTIVNNINDIIVGKMDCMYDQETSKTCKNQTKCLLNYTNKDKQYLHCCCDNDYCNYNIIINNLVDNHTSTVTTTTTTTPPDCGGYVLCNKFLIMLICLIISLIIIIIIVCINYRKKFVRSQEKICRIFDKSLKSDPSIVTPLIPSDKEININDLIIENILKKGRFSEIYQARLNNKQVAVKILSNKIDLIHSKILFEHEKNIYSLTNMKHKNILEYYGYCITNDDNYIIVELSKYGSLSDVLEKRLLKDEYELILILKDISDGLEYLHTDYRRFNSRPPIAHRDLKSDNILYLNDNRLVISDFAMAIQLDQNQNYPNEQQQIGTARYMSPEILAGTIGCETNALLKCDVYALGIIFWEVLSRYPNQDNDNKYEKAYDKQLIEHGLNCKNPEVNDMLKIINLEKPFNRPFIKSSWKTSDNRIIKEILFTMEQCWDQNPEGRINAALVALRMKQLL
ncbi:unnamed protein product [Rotaria sp. Silwood1]|nr:unnamed protein product [Rotaria sp. Silwood1]CAF4960955.1 unnamed protein product [Rotaria sp. Silwood1]